MKLWGYYALHTLWNSIKKMFRSTVLVVILACVGFIGICGIAGGIIGSVVSDGQDSTEMSSEISTEAVATGDGEEAQEELTEDEEMSPEDVAMVKTWVEAVVVLILLVVLLWGLYSGSKSGADIFPMADVNFLFTAPLKPQTVLMFRLSFQMMAALVASLYLVFQIPNLVINLGLGAPAVVAVFAGYIMLLIFQRLMVVLSYTVFTTHEHMKKYVLPFIAGIALLILGALAIVFFAVDRDLYRMVQVTLGSQWMRMVPVLGWYKGMIMSAVNSRLLPFFIYLFLLILSIVVLVFIIWHIKADFYEDAFSAASKTAEMVADAQQGRMVQTKKRSEKIRRNGSFGGTGASAFFTKEVYCRKRTAKFGFLTNTMFFYLGAGLVLGFITVHFMESHSFMMTGCAIFGIMFFRNMGNPIAQETSFNWLFLVPDNPYKKVFYAMLAGTYDCAVDLIPGLVAGMVLVGVNPFTVILWFVTLVIADFMLSSVGLLLETIFPSSALDLVKSVLHMILQFAMILVLIGFMAGGYVLGGETAALILTAVCSALMGGICFIFYPSMLHRGL